MVSKRQKNWARCAISETTELPNSYTAFGVGKCLEAAGCYAEVSANAIYPELDCGIPSKGQVQDNTANG